MLVTDGTVIDGVVVIQWPVTEVAIRSEPLVEIHGALGISYMHRRLPASKATVTYINLLTVYLYLIAPALIHPVGCRVHPQALPPESVPNADGPGTMCPVRI